ncbi:sugar kinase [Streptomyces alkaliterrae]|uniref:Sugar kinase n=1 Tax=Streptomyces alkaliterrae TaxID=2213162 RepID=A0A5P0YKQ0_9ACTN|nr:sugar kinase [Streptomyces alkaliterrae]MBB1255344.1 sugar kinase [Streptomyces alkaliterrae]MBB1258145.1 sugar kinase [Streptomyces alkaliterrae]MQS00876.1 sugar kinase [Streptomyces alkaliterrae]
MRAVTSRSPYPVDLVCLGESMVALRPDRPTSLAGAELFARGVGGAESNVACALAAAGHTVRWISRLGADGFGDHLLATVAAAGVDTTWVDRDPDRPTGVYFRTDGERGATLEVAYYRAGSAASALCPANVDPAAADSGRVLHLTGITPALSDGCLDLVRELTAPRPARPLVSFDVNYRADLWRGRDPALLRDLAARADLVFVGADEAAHAWGTRACPHAVRRALPEPATLVVKEGGRGATVLTAGTRPEVVHVPAPRVDVVAPVGAGDAFAAGYLSATLRGLPLPLRLRHGHLAAAAALTVPGDHAGPPPRALVERLAALDDPTWATLRLARDWATAENTPEGSPS